MGLFCDLLDYLGFSDKINESYSLGRTIQKKLKEIDQLRLSKGLAKIVTDDGKDMTIGEYFKANPVSATKSCYESAVFYQQISWLRNAIEALDAEIDALRVGAV